MADEPTVDTRDRFRGMILGTAVGDAVGLPAEGMSRKRIAKFVKGRWRHRLVFGRGMVSDDTEHTCFTSREQNRVYSSDRHLRESVPVQDWSDPLPCSSAWVAA